MQHDVILLSISAILGFFMVWGVGANDLANVLSTALGSKSIGVRQAILIAIVFEFAGAFLGGSGVTHTMRHGIISLHILKDSPDVLMYGMLAILLAGTIWLNIASHYGLPVSITNAIVGAFVGFGAIVLGPHAIHWKQVMQISLTWLFSPAIAAVLSYLLFITIQHTIFVDEKPLSAAKRYINGYALLVGMVLSAIIIIKGLRHFHIEYTILQETILVILCGILVALLAGRLIHQVTKNNLPKRRLQFQQIEKMFAILMAFTACAMVFAHGSNDVAVAVGPLSVLSSKLGYPSHSHRFGDMSQWIMLYGCVGVIAGLVVYGRKVIETVGTGITALTPSRAFAATLSAACIVVVSTSTGIPISATQTLVGAVFGVGLARGIGALNLVVIRNIMMSWAITLPAVSILTILFYEIFEWLYL